MIRTSGGFKQKLKEYFLLGLLIGFFDAAVLIVYLIKGRDIFDTNLLVALATTSLVVLAGVQLKEISRSNYLQMLFKLEDEWNSSQMLKRRIVLANDINSCLAMNQNTDLEKNNWNKLQNNVENVLDYFEKLALLVEFGKLPMKIIYEMYSWYLQGYWELVERIGYVSRVRKEHIDGNDFYAKTEKLYKKLMSEFKLEKFADDEYAQFIAEELDIAK